MSNWIYWPLATLAIAFAFLQGTLFGSFLFMLYCPTLMKLLK